jgi:hypothetical protein
MSKMYLDSIDKEIFEGWRAITRKIAKHIKEFPLELYDRNDMFPTYHLGIVLYQYATLSSYIGFFTAEYENVWKYSIDAKIRKSVAEDIRTTIEYLKFVWDTEKPENVNVKTNKGVLYFSPMGWLLLRMIEKWNFDVRQMYQFKKQVSNIVLRDKIANALEEGIKYFTDLTNKEKVEKNSFSARILEWSEFWRKVAIILLRGESDDDFRELLSTLSEVSNEIKPSLDVLVSRASYKLNDIINNIERRKRQT